MFPSFRKVANNKSSPNRLATVCGRVSLHRVRDAIRKSYARAKPNLSTRNWTGNEMLYLHNTQ